VVDEYTDNAHSIRQAMIDKMAPSRLIVLELRVESASVVGNVQS